MKRTIEVDAPLLAEAERVAAEQHTTVDALLRDALLRVIAECETHQRASNGYALPDRSVGGDGSFGKGGRGLQPPFTDDDWGAIRRASYGDRG